MEFVEIKKKDLYTWVNPITKKKEDVKGERIAAFKVNYPKAKIEVVGKKDISSKRGESKSKETKSIKSKKEA